jgi:hypothetical protein
MTMLHEPLFDGCIGLPGLTQHSSLIVVRSVDLCCSLPLPYQASTPYNPFR